MFTLVEKTVKLNLSKIISSENTTQSTESLIAGTIAMALCYIARVQRKKPPGSKVLLPTLTLTQHKYWWLIFVFFLDKYTYFGSYGKRRFCFAIYELYECIFYCTKTKCYYWCLFVGSTFKFAATGLWYYQRFVPESSSTTRIITVFIGKFKREKFYRPSEGTLIVPASVKLSLYSYWNAKYIY